MVRAETEFSPELVIIICRPGCLWCVAAVSLRSFIGVTDTGGRKVSFPIIFGASQKNTSISDEDAREYLAILAFYIFSKNFRFSLSVDRFLMAFKDLVACTVNFAVV